MSTTTIARTACKYPGCGQPAAPAAGTGPPPEYCAGRGHTRVSAWRERRRLAAEQIGNTISPAEDGSPLTTAKMTGAELLRSLRAEAGRITALGAGLRDRIDTLTDPTAAEAEVEAVRAAAGQRAATAEARAAAAGQRAATAEQLRAEADAAAEEMSEHLTDAQARAQPTRLCDQVDWSQAGERVRRQDFRSRRLEGCPAGPGVSRGAKPVIRHKPAKPSLVPGHWRRIASIPAWRTAQRRTAATMMASSA